MENATNQEAPPMQSEEDIDRYFEGRIRRLTQKEAYAKFERLTRHYFDMSPEEFILAYRSGKLDDHPNHTDVEYVGMLIPLAE